MKEQGRTERAKGKQKTKAGSKPRGDSNDDIESYNQKARSFSDTNRSFARIDTME